MKSIRKTAYAILVCLFTVAGAGAEPMETRLFIFERFGDSFEPRVQDVQATMFKTWLTTNGVSWPTGSCCYYVDFPESFFVANTVSNLALITRLMAYSVERMQVQVEVQFVAFPVSEIEPLAVRNEVTRDKLLELWSGGKGKLICNPKVTTRLGSEATIRGVREILYPTEYVLPVKEDGSNSVPVVGEAVPANFETREEGGILSVIPEIDATQTQILLNLRPEWISLADWAIYGPPESRRQPVFYRASCETQISIMNGDRLLIGGGVPGKEKDTLVFVFVTARLQSAFQRGK